jgi:putative ABC transport system substrate-binding protein
MGQVLRRWFLITASALLAVPLGVPHAASLPRIVVLSLSAPENQMRAFEEGLRARGLIDGSTVILTHRTAAGREDALMRRAAEAVSLSPKVIVAVGTKAAIAAKRLTNDIPIVAVTGDMVSAGLVKNFGQPEGNVTGFSFFTVKLTQKRLELLMEVNPSLRRLKILVPVRRHRSHVKALSALNESLKAKEIDVEVVGVAHVDALEAIIASIGSSSGESLLMVPSVMFDTRAREIGKMLVKHRAIAMLPWKEYVVAGGLMSYSPDIVAIWRKASTYVDRILRGAKPSELPVEQPRNFELVVNAKTAKAIGITIPPSILLRANWVIE